MEYFAIKRIIEMLGVDVHKLGGKTAIWTGTGGFLGTIVIEVFKALNKDVLATPCRLIGYDMRLPDRDVIEELKECEVHFCAHNLTKRFELDVGPVDYVVHMAGIASPHHYKNSPLQTIDVALEGSRSALEIAKHHKARYLFTSSSEVYKTATVIPTPETYVGAIPSIGDRSCYDVSKLMGENLAYVYWKEFGVNSGSVRIFNSFGPGLSESDYRILPRIASSIVGKVPLQVFRNKQMPTRTYCFAANTIAGIFLALINGKSGEIYNIGADNPEVSVVELIDRISSATGHRVQHELVDPPEVYAYEPLRRCPDITKARSELGYEPFIDLETGLSLFFEWALPRYRGVK